ncbi:outer membrane receptor protein involved in Fe transport [Pedobacter cryoconitis]|uniref:Outer membrane receptor protein involved in Fe transport n=1 Tax=Pedobacter cryoconitis TaxID=188932 RepID=A0A7W9DZG2_9SPHI|nr:TonB-dependent receptor [Pedobacter cryoconitis]MBB5635515.1 outer membrane receptor protein involved in Fe transport [Pedobacter cryoconitis]
MQIKKIFLTGILCALIFFVQAQSGKNGTIKGTVFNDQSEAIPGAHIQLLPLNKTTVSDGKGEFSFTGLAAGTYKVKIHALGHVKTERDLVVTDQKVLTVSFKIKQEAREIDEVAILGFSKNQKTNRQAYNVISIDAKMLHNTTMDLGQVMNRVSGARVRESGGVGSDMTFSLNGFSGNQVKFFLDGIPMENFGSSFQLNNIPVNFADRIEVYKGVVPVWLGGDALGGAVNIVTNTDPRTYVDASYSYGSFNTHKSSVNAGYTAKSGFTVQLNAFQNYSDNNYWVTGNVTDSITGVNTLKRVRRFHDQYHNETVIANVGVSGKKYADQFLIGITLGQNKADIQVGNRMEDVFGARWKSGNTIQPTLKYVKKDLFVKGLDLRVNGNFNFGEGRNVDTVPRTFTWDGTSQPRYRGKPDAVDGEVKLADFKFKDHSGLANAGLNYNLNEQHSFSLNEQFSTFSRKGLNRFDPENLQDKQPQISRKNILGLGYRFNLNEKLNFTAFTKKYDQYIASNDVVSGLDKETKEKVYTILSRNSDLSKLGYGFAGSYFLTESIQLKASYEKSYRLPNNEEVFGNVYTTVANLELMPERSDNVNIGATYTAEIDKIHFFQIQANYIFRNANDYIRARVLPGGSNGTYLSVFENIGKVTNRGIDAEIRYAYKQLFTLNTNFTYQNLRNDNEFEKLKNGEFSKIRSVLYRDRIPNTPYLFGNANASLYFSNVLEKGNQLTLGYNLLYVNKFYLYWPGQGEKGGKMDVPTQWSHDVNMIYSMSGGKYNIAVECLNLTDSNVFDNYALQKPSRSFNIKLRYYFSKKRGS